MHDASNRQAVAAFANWLSETSPEVEPDAVTREHMGAFLVEVRESRSASTARGWFSGLRHFFRWMVAEEEADQDPTAGIKTPAASEPDTPVLTTDQLRALLEVCAGRGFVKRRDAAIIRLFLDTGVRLAELSGLKVDDVDLSARAIYVTGKGDRRSGPRSRAVPIGLKTAQAVDRYLRERRRHPHADSPQLWLGDGKRSFSYDGVKAMLKRRGAQAGIRFHPHMFRHTFAHQFRAAGGSEGDLMLLGGWRSRTMLDRYGRTVAADRAREAGRRLSLGDRL